MAALFTLLALFVFGSLKWRDTDLETDLGLVDDSFGPGFDLAIVSFIFTTFCLVIQVHVLRKEAALDLDTIGRS